MIAVIGRSGQLAQAFSELIKATFLEKDEIGEWKFASNLLPDRQKLFSYLHKLKPSLIINTAAYTEVDKAESEKEFCQQLNVELPRALAEYCRESQIPLVHYSTDYVYSGSGSTAYAESDATGPLSYYGLTKLEGDNVIIGISKLPAKVEKPTLQFLIFRTSWVYSDKGKNFVKTMLRLGIEKAELKIVDDQVGAPTSALDLARYTLEILDRQKSSGWKSGIYHLTNTGAVSWRNFAEEIFSQAMKRDSSLQVPKIIPITTAEYPTRAIRPLNSRLSLEKMKTDFFITPRPWQDALNEILDRLIESR